MEKEQFEQILASIKRGNGPALTGNSLSFDQVKKIDAAINIFITNTESEVLKKCSIEYFKNNVLCKLSGDDYLKFTQSKNKTITGDEPANPAGAWGQQTTTGLTIKQQIAKDAMCALLSNPGFLDTHRNNNTASMIDTAVRSALYAADELINKLNP